MVLAGTDETTIWWAVMGGEIFRDGIHSYAGTAFKWR
jgi:hypothetical protein